MTKINQSFFDQEIDRTKNGSSKWSKYSSDVLPMWIADMDFRVSPIILEALKEDMEHAVFGYQKETPDLNPLVCKYLKEAYSWEVLPDEIIWLPSARSAMYVACSDVCQGKVVTSSPIYPPFLMIPKRSGKELVDVPLLESSGQWRLDFEAIEENLEEGDLFMLCNPHNPIGKVWKRSDLEKLSEIVCSKKAFLLSDEVHSGLILDDSCTHLPVAGLNDEIAQRTITINGTGKSYNISGLCACFAVVKSPKIRAKFIQAKVWLSDVPVSGYSASKAVYQSSMNDEWKRELIKYLKENHRILIEGISNIEGISMSALEATYLAWIDCRDFASTSTAIDNFAEVGRFFEKNGLGLGDGVHFGKPGFVRLNFATSRYNVKKALGILKRACS